MIPNALTLLRHLDVMYIGKHNLLLCLCTCLPWLSFPLAYVPWSLSLSRCWKARFCRCLQPHAVNKQNLNKWHRNSLIIALCESGAAGACTQGKVGSFHWTGLCLHRQLSVLLCRYFFFRTYCCNKVAKPYGILSSYNGLNPLRWPLEIYCRRDSHLPCCRSYSLFHRLPEWLWQWRVKCL